MAQGTLVLGVLGFATGIGLLAGVHDGHRRLVVGVGVGLLVVVGGALLSLLLRGANSSRLTAVTGALRAVRPSARGWVAAVGLAGLSLVADCGCLALSFVAIRQNVPWRGLVVAYGVGQLASRVPLTPGGLGIVEGGLAATLAIYGTPTTSTLGAVLVYRLVSYWAFTGMGWVAIICLTGRRGALLRGAPVASGT